MKKWNIAVLIILAVVVLAFFMRSNQANFSTGSDSNKGNTDFGELALETTQDGGGISNEELLKHNGENGCWVVYNGKVYDVTDYLTRHPGGKNKISQNCGTKTQFEEQFTNQHGTSKVSLLMNVATFIGDFDVIGNFDSQNTESTGNTVITLGNGEFSKDYGNGEFEVEFEVEYEYEDD